MILWFNISSRWLEILFSKLMTPVCYFVNQWLKFDELKIHLYYFVFWWLNFVSCKLMIQVGCLDKLWLKFVLQLYDSNLLLYMLMTQACFLQVDDSSWLPWHVMTQVFIVCRWLKSVTSQADDSVLTSGRFWFLVLQFEDRTLLSGTLRVN